MKKIVTLVLLCSVALFANNTLFSGTWCVEEQEMEITFGEKGTVIYNAEEGMNGEGNFELVNDTLVANIANEDMEITIKYTYKEDGESVLVKTASIIINGEAIEHSEEWITLQRCGK